MIKTNDSLGETPESSQGLGKFLGIGLVILALWSFLSEKTPNQISIAGIKRRKSKRLFYMLDAGKGLTSVSRQDVDNIKERNPNRLHAVWALTASDARALIKAGQGERYTGSTKKLDFAGHLLNCIGWQQVIDKKGKQITRCFIMAPNCKTKACVKETEERKAEGWKPKGRKVKLEGVNSKSFIIDSEGKIAMVVGSEKGKPVVIYPGNDGGTRAGSAQQGGGQPYEYVLNSWTPATEKDFNKVIRPSGSQRMNDLRRWRRELQTGLQGVNLSCKQYVRDAYNKLRCKKYAITCNSENECSPKAPIPWKAVETEYSEKAIKSVAKMLANEMNQSIDDTKRVMRRIKYHGGIAPYSGGYLQEEYRSIPSKYKSKQGVKLDELAQEMEMDESELVEAIGKAEEARSRLPRKKSRFAVKDLMFEAESYLAKQEGLSGFSGIGYKISSKIRPFVKRYGLSTIDHTWDSHDVKIDKFPEKDLVVYLSRAGWILSDRYGNPLDKIKKGNAWGTEGFNTKEEALDHYISTLSPTKKPEKKIAEKGGQMTLFGIEDVSQENLEKFKKFMSKYNDKTQFLDDYMAYSGGIKINKAIGFYELEIERAKRNAPIDPEERKPYTRIINDLSALVEAMPPEFDDLTFNAVWSLAKLKEQPKQMTLFGKLQPYYFKDTGYKVFVSDNIKYHRGPAFKRVDRYRMEILDEDKKHIGTMSNREIETQLTKNKPAIQSYLFGKLVARKIALRRTA